MPLFDLQLILKLLGALVVAFCVSFAATPIVRSFAQRIGAMDVPTEARRVHDHPIPRMGGLAIFLGFILSVVLFVDVTRPIQGVLLGSVLIAAVGAVDDLVSLPAWLKFLLQIGAALIAVAFGVRIEVVMNPNIFSSKDYLILGWASIPVTVLWIVAITNSVNLIDGLDGLAVGVSAISTLTMLVIAVLVAQTNDAIVMAALTGACVGFMPYNLNPAKIFMGDCGALLLGYVLATMSVVGLFKFYAVVSFAVPVLALAVPLADTTFAFFRRLLKGQNPMKPDRGHFHHRLLDMGLNQKQAVAVLYALSAILGLTAVVLSTSGEQKVLIFIVAFLIAAVIWIFAVLGRRHVTIHPSGVSAPQEAAPQETSLEETALEDTKPEDPHVSER